MKVKCISNLGKSLSEKTIESGESRTTVYHLNIDRIYNAYSICIWKGTLYYLISDDDWYPAELFEVIDHLLSPTWFFDVRQRYYFDLKKKQRCEFREAIWGYKEIALDPKHKTDLLERDPKANAIFKQRKEEIDEYEELRSKHPKI